MNISMTRFDTDVVGGLQPVLPKIGQINCSTDNVNLEPGRYYLNVAFFSNNTLEDHLVGVCFFDIMDSDYFGTGKKFGASRSKVLLKHQWKLSGQNG